MNEGTRDGVPTQKMLEAIRKGNPHILQEVYLEHRQSFLEWAVRRFKCKEEDALDIYQETIIAFHENVSRGKLTQLNSSIRTYLFGIGKILIIKSFRTQNRTEPLPDWEQEDEESYYLEEELELSEQQQLIRKALRQLGESCQKILQLFYYRRFSNEVIRQRLGYQSTDVVKSQKARCMRKLRKLAKQNLKDDLR
jgi:RNA polymerase sigma factor (sigma-70 family)